MMNHMRALAIAEGHKKGLPTTNENKGGIGCVEKHKNAKVMRDEIIKLVTKSGPMTIRDISKATGEHEQATSSRCQRLRELGRIYELGKRGAFTLWGIAK